MQVAILRYAQDLDARPEAGVAWVPSPRALVLPPSLSHDAPPRFSFLFHNDALAMVLAQKGEATAAVTDATALAGPLADVDPGQTIREDEPEVRLFRSQIHCMLAYVRRISSLPVSSLLRNVGMWTPYATSSRVARRPRMTETVRMSRHCIGQLSTHSSRLVGISSSRVQTSMQRAVTLTRHLCSGLPGQLFFQSARIATLEWTGNLV